MKPRNNRIRFQKKTLILLGVLILALALIVALVVWLMVGQGAPPGPAGPSVTVQSDPLPSGTDPSIQTSPDTGPSETTLETQTQPEQTTAPVETEPSKPPETSPPVQIVRPTDPVVKPTQPAVGKDEIADGDLSCEEFALFSGQYVEDGRDELVTNVAAILVKNRSDRFLDLATLSFDIDGKTATFIVTGLPAGRSAWVMEATRMTATHSSVFTYQSCVTSFKDGVIAQSRDVTITADGNMLTAVNNTGKTLENVCVYYRTVHTDGNFFGGITYLVDFGTLEPGQSAETLAGHYDGSKSEIVRISWQTG